MTPERWQHVNELFTAVVELEPEERAAFLDQCCSADPMLRSEIESLIASDGREWSLIETPALEVAAPLLTDDRPQFAPGQKIDRYEVVSLIGRGGMGEVYLATDEKLNRRIALKLLPANYTRDKYRLRLFQQEAQAASALNHPNILTIHELGEVDGRHFIATEFVDGETLRQRLKRRPLTTHETLEIAIQIASALASAHQAGIVHRDIKPENVMIRPDGYVKLLDFGLAKLTEHNERTPATRGVENADLSSDLLMGTVKYMSPEQACGMNVDARSDIFSLGVILYEMVAGRTPFEGETTSDLIEAILNEEPPPLTLFLPEASKELQHIVSSSLRKERDERYPAIQDLLIDLRRLKSSLELEAQLESSRALKYQGGPKTVSGQREAVHTANETALSASDLAQKHKGSSAGLLVTGIGRHKSWGGATATLLLLATLGGGYLTYKAFVPKRAASSRSIELSWMTTSGKVGGAAISPDGRYIAYFNGAGVWTREVATNSQVEIIPGGKGDYWGLTFSRDGNFLYYFADLTTDGEPPALYRVPAAGGVPSKLIANIQNTNGTYPITFSPDGAHLAFVREYDSGETALIVANFDGADERKLATRHSPPSYLGSAAWSPDGKKIVCNGGYQETKTHHQDLVEIGVEDGVEKPIATQEFYYIGNIAWAADGSSLLLTASDRENEPTQVWDIAYPTGTARRISADLSSYVGLSLTADSSVLVTVRIQTTYNIWAQSAEGGEAKQITSGLARKDGIAGIGWTPDGSIVYSSNASGRHDIWTMNADGANAKQLTLDMGTDRLGLSVSPDGRYVVFVSNRSGADNIWRIDIDGTNPKQLTNGSRELNPVFSPDGQWVTYKSSDSGRPIPWKVPVDGGEPIPAAGPDDSVEPRLRAALGISPDGSLIAYNIPLDNRTDVNRVGVASVYGGDPIRILDLPPRARLLHMRWTPDGRALTFIDNRGTGPNIWSQPLDGGPAQQLTDFKTGNIFNFDWSRDGTDLAIVRTSGSSDVVLMRNFR